MINLSHKNKILGFGLSSVLLLAAALRIYRLGYQSFWLDEVLNINWSKISSLRQILQVLSRQDNSPPLYYLFLHFWMKLGSSEFMLRLPSAIAGIIAVFLIFKIGEALFDRNTGLLAAFLATVSPFYLWVSQEARMYAFLSLFSLFSFYFFIRAIKKNSVNPWLGYIVFSVLAIYTHYYALFTIFAEIIYFSFNMKKFKHCIKNYLVSLIVFFVLFIPCLFFLFQQFSVSSRRLGGLFSSTIWAIPHAFFDFSTGYSLLQIELANFFQNVYHNLSVIIFSGVIFITVFISGLLYILRQKKGAVIILFYFFIPFIVSYLISRKVHIFGSKYLVASAGAYFLILACGLKNLKPKWVSVIFALGILIINGVSITNYYFNDNFTKGGFREAANFIEKSERQGDIIVFPQPSEVAFQYYFRGKSLILGVISKDGNILDNIEVIMKGYKRVWFMPDLQKIFDPNNLTQKWLSSQGKIEKEYKFKGVSVIGYILNQS